MKISRRVKTGCALALAGLLALPCVNLMQTRAAGPVIEDRACSLTISAEAGVFGEDEGKDDFEGMNIPVKVYKTADVNVSGNFTTLDAFKGMDFNISMNTETNAETWSSLAEDAVKKLKDNSSIEPAGEGTIEEGTPAVISDLKVGMYLVVPEETFNANKTVKYVFTPVLAALPSSEYTLTGTGSDEWIYDRNDSNNGENFPISLKGKAEQQYGRLTINKTLDNYNTTLGPVTCVFSIEGTDSKGKVYSEVASITLNSADKTESVTLDHIPAGLNVTVTEIYSGASYRVTSEKDVGPTEIWSDERVGSGDPVSVNFTNAYDGGGQGGYGVTNHFEVEGKGDEAQWQWENPTTPPAE